MTSVHPDERSAWSNARRPDGDGPPNTWTDCKPLRRARPVGRTARDATRSDSRTACRRRNIPSIYFKNPFQESDFRKVELNDQIDQIDR
nr:hypothetical protein [Burkholderia mayonis]